MSSVEKIIATLSTHKNLLNKMGKKNIGVFGSYIRNDKSDSSDIDILIDFDTDQEKFDNYMSICNNLENIFTN